MLEVTESEGSHTLGHFEYLYCCLLDLYTEEEGRNCVDNILWNKARSNTEGSHTLGHFEYLYCCLLDLYTEEEGRNCVDNILWNKARSNTECSNITLLCLWKTPLGNHKSDRLTDIPLQRKFFGVLMALRKASGKTNILYVHYVNTVELHQENGRLREEATAIVTSSPSDSRLSSCFSTWR